MSDQPNTTPIKDIPVNKDDAFELLCATAIIGDRPVSWSKSGYEKFQAIQTYIDNKILEARIRELENYLNDSIAHPPTYTRKRISKLKRELKSNLSKGTPHV